MAKFQKGQSGNPGGRPKESVEVKALILEATKNGKLFVEKLLDFVQFAPEPKDKLAALKIMMEYSLGKPKQTVELAGDTQVTIIVETGVPKPGEDAASS